jgi:hypothetical protein
MLSGEDLEDVAAAGACLFQVVLRR